MDRSVEQSLYAAYPPGTEVLDTRSYRPGYLPYPMRVSVRTPEGSTEQCVIKTGDGIEPLTREAGVLRFLAETGLPVPAVLAGPFALTDRNEGGALMVLSELPGQALPWCGVTSLAEADLTCCLLIRGVLRLHELTEQVSRHEIARTLPRVTLSSELGEIVQRGSRREFAPRLVLRCLRHLQKEVSVHREEDAVQRGHMLNVLAEGLSAVEP